MLQKNEKIVHFTNMYYVIDLDNVVTIGGEKYLIDFLLLPTWNSGMDSPIWNRLYVRIDPTVPEDVPPYCTQRRLVDNGPVYYYHPCVPFDVMQSRCSNWISWGDVRIRHESGLVGREETISLLRIKSGLDLQQIQQSTMTDLCFVIEGKFPSNSTLNWNQWLFPGKQEQCRKGFPSSLSDDDKTDSSALIARQNVQTGLKAIEYLPLDKSIKQETDASSPDAVEPKTANAEFLRPIPHHDGNTPTFGVENPSSNQSKISQLSTTAIVAATGGGVNTESVVTGTNSNNNNPAAVFAAPASLQQNQSGSGNAINRMTRSLDSTSTNAAVSVDPVDLPQQVSRFFSLMLQSSGNSRTPIENASTADMQTQPFSLQGEIEPKTENNILRQPPRSVNAGEEDFDSAPIPRIIERSLGGRSTAPSTEKPRYRSLSILNNSNAPESSTTIKRKTKIKYPLTNNQQSRKGTECSREFLLDDCFDAEGDDQEDVLPSRPTRRFDKEQVGFVDDVYENATIDQRAFAHKPPEKRWKNDSTKRLNSFKAQGSKPIPQNHYYYDQQQTTRPFVGNQVTLRRQRRSSTSNPDCNREYGAERLIDEPASQFGTNPIQSKSTMKTNPSRSVSDDEGGSSSSARDGSCITRLDRQMVDPFSTNTEEWNAQDFQQPQITNFRRPLRPYREKQQSFYLARSPEVERFDS